MYQSRYRTLDAWRGAAALGVFFHHRFLNLLPLMGGLWMAVQLFFVISGYCIAAAADNAIVRGNGFAAFMRRRVQRIAPPYLASCLFAIALRILWHGFRPLAHDWKMYLQNLTMLQWVSITHAQFGGGAVPSSASANPQLLVTAYWSLNYEEQFYLIAALLVALALAWRLRAAAAALTGLTVWVALFNFSHNGLVTGLFCDYWLQFACGVALYFRLCKLPSVRATRLFDAALAAALAAAVYAAAIRHELSLDAHTFHYYGQLTLCVAFACLLLILRPFDDYLAKSLPGRIFGKVGTFSYSLYVAHIPLLGLFHGLERRIGPHIGKPATYLLSVSLVIGGSWLFYRFFERPWLNAPAQKERAPEPLVEEDQLISPSAAA